MIAIKSNDCLKPTQLCIKSQNECKGSYDEDNRFKIVCDKMNCSGRHSVQCEKDFCSVDSKSCSDFKNIRFMISSIVNPQMHVKKMYKYTKLLENIKNCSYKKYSLKASDICKNENGCIKKRPIPMRSGFVSFYHRANCLCRGNYTFECGLDHCTTNQTVCDEFKFKNFTISNDSNDSNEFKACGNPVIVF